MPRLGLYQPFIEDRNVRRLYRLKVQYRARTGRTLPMTTLVNRILDDFFGATALDVEDELLPDTTPIAPEARASARSS